jgi:hypothetical protein
MVQIMIIEVWLHTFVSSALGGGQWLYSTFDRFTLGKGSLVPITMGGPQSPPGRFGETSMSCIKEKPDSLVTL